MTRQEVIEDLRNRIYKNRITNIDDLRLEISHAEYEGETIDEYEDVLHPIYYNTCDRCGDIGDDTDFIWVDCFPWEDDNPDDQAILKALEQEGIDYCAICEECAKELTKKGKELNSGQ